MSFKDMLDMRANVYFVEHSTSNRTTKDQVKNSATANYTNIPCRIITKDKTVQNKYDKVIVAAEHEIPTGSILECLLTGVKYTVKESKLSRATGYIHHRTYFIEKRGIQ